MSSVMRIIAVILSVLLAGCYEYERPPFSQADMKPITESAFGREIIASKDLLSRSDTKESRAFAEMLDGSLAVYEVSPTFLILQKDEKGKTQLLTLMKNQHHLFACFPMEDKKEEKRVAAEGITIRKGKSEGLWNPKVVSGGPEAVKAWALNYAVSGHKICMAVPYADARGFGANGLDRKTETSQGKSKSGSWISNPFH